jgi:hypothetical protein
MQHHPNGRLFSVVVATNRHERPEGGAVAAAATAPPACTGPGMPALYPDGRG